MLHGLIFATICVGFASFSAGVRAGENPVVVLDTSVGAIEIELDSAKAPVSVENFLKYVDKGFYNGTVFHRVVPGFVVQGGGMTPDMKEKKTDAPIKNEAKNGLSNARGTVAMARTNDPNSATSQFYVNLSDNDMLDTYGGGYAVFGKVVAGMDAVDKIAAVKTGNKGGHSDVPVEAIVIKSAKRK